MCDRSDPTETCCSIFWGPPINKHKSSPRRSKSCISAFPPNGLFIQNCDEKDNSDNFYTSPMCNTNLVRNGVSAMDLYSRPRKLTHLNINFIEILAFSEEYICYYTMDC